MAKKVVELSKKTLLFVSLIILVAWIIVSVICIGLYGYEVWEGSNKVYNIFTVIAGISLAIAYGSYRSLASLRDSVEYIINQIPRKWHEFIDSTYTPYYTPEIYTILKGKYRRIVDKNIEADDVGLPIVDITAPLVSFNSDIYLTYYGPFLDDSTEIVNTISNYLISKDIFDAKSKAKHVYDSLNNIMMIVVVGKNCMVVRPRVREDLLIHKSNYHTFIGQEVHESAFKGFVIDAVVTQNAYKTKLSALSWLISNTLFKPTNAFYERIDLYQNIKKEIDSMLLLMNSVVGLSHQMIIMTLMAYLQDPNNEASYHFLEFNYSRGCITKLMTDATTTILQSAEQYINSMTDVIFQRDLFYFILDESRTNGINMNTIMSKMYEDQSIRECVITMKLLTENMTKGNLESMVSNLNDNITHTEADSIHKLLPYINNKSVKSLIKKHNRQVLKKQLKKIKLLSIGIKVGNPMNYFRNSNAKSEIEALQSVERTRILSKIPSNTQNATIEIINRPITNNIVKYANAESKIQQELLKITMSDDDTSKKRESALKKALHKVSALNEMIRNITNKKKDAALALPALANTPAPELAKAAEEIYSMQQDLNKQEEELNREDIFLSLNSVSQSDNVFRDIKLLYGIQSDPLDYDTMIALKSNIQANENLINSAIGQSEKLPADKKENIIQRTQSLKSELQKIKSQTNEVARTINDKNYEIKRRNSIGPIQISQSNEHSIVDINTIYDLEKQVRKITNAATELNTELVKDITLETVKKSFNIGIKNAMAILTPIEHLEKKNEQIEADKSSIVMQMNILDPTSDAYRELQSKYNQLQTESIDIQKRVNELQKAIEVEKHTTNELKQTLENKNMQVEELSQQFQRNQQNHDQQIKKYELKTQEINQLNERLQQQANVYNQQLSGMKQQYEINQNQLQTLQTKLEQQTNRQSVEFYQIQQLYNQKMQENVSIQNELNNRSSKYEATIQELKAQYINTQRELDEMKQKFNEQSNAMTANENELVSKYQSKVNELDKKRKQAQETNKQLENEIITKNESLNEIMQELVKNKSDSKKSRIIDLLKNQALLESKRQEKLKHLTEVGGIQTMMQSIRATNASLIQEKEKQIQEITQLKLQLGKVLEETNTMYNSNNQQQITDLNNEINAKMAIVTELETKQKNQDQEISRLNNRVLSMQNALDENEKLLKDYENQILQYDRLRNELSLREQQQKNIAEAKIAEIAYLKAEYETKEAQQKEHQQELLDQISEYENINASQNQQIETLQTCITSVSQLESDIFNTFLKNKFRIGEKKTKINLNYSLFKDLVGICSLDAKDFLNLSSFNKQISSLMSDIYEANAKLSNQTNFLKENLGKLLTIILSIKWYIDNVPVGEVMLKDKSIRPINIIEKINRTLHRCGVNKLELGPSYLPNMAIVLELNREIDNLITNKLITISNTRSLVNKRDNVNLQQESHIKWIIAEALRYGFGPEQFIDEFNAAKVHSLSALSSNVEQETPIVSPRQQLSPREQPSIGKRSTNNYNQSRQLAPINTPLPPPLPERKFRGAPSTNIQFQQE